jgi:hypothetical protein
MPLKRKNGLINERKKRGTRPPSNRGKNVPFGTKLLAQGEFFVECAKKGFDKKTILSDNRKGTGINTIAVGIETKHNQKENSLKGRLKNELELFAATIDESDEFINHLIKSLPAIKESFKADLKEIENKEDENISEV